VVDQSGGFSPSEEMRRDALRYADLVESVVQEAAEVVSGVEGTDPQVLFPLPGEKRDEDPGFELDESQETQLRELASKLGFGRETDRTPEMAGLSVGYDAIIEGGQPHKVEAERRLVAATAGRLIFCGSPNRKITADAERQSAAHVLTNLRRESGVEDATIGDEVSEYDVIRQIAEAQPGFVPQADEDLGYGYDINARNLVLPVDGSGQFKQIGHIASQFGDAPVIMMRIDREDYTDAEGKPRYRNQPDSAAVVRIVSDVTRMQGDIETPIAFVTSATYEPSRAVDGYRAGITTDREVKVVTYGTSALAAVRGEDPVPASITQLPGELRRAYDQTQQLRTELA